MARLTIDDKIFKTLNEYCEKDGRTRKWIIENAIKQFINAVPKEELKPKKLKSKEEDFMDQLPADIREEYIQDLKDKEESIRIDELKKQMDELKKQPPIKKKRNDPFNLFPEIVKIDHDQYLKDIEKAKKECDEAVKITFGEKCI